MTPRSSYQSCASRFSQAGSVLVALVGAAVLVDAGLFGGAPGLATMKANSAFAFLAAGVALWLLNSPTRASRSVALALSVAVVALGGLSLAQDLFRINLGIDQFIMRDVPQAASALHPGRMAPTTALSFLLIGLALLGLSARQSRPVVARAYWLAVGPLFVSSIAIVGYAYDVTSLYKVGPYSSMAAHSALSFFILSLCILAANPTRGLANIVTSETAGGIMARRLLPTVPLILFGLGWARLEGEEAGYFDSHFGLALMVVLSIGVCVFVVASTAVSLHTVDVERRKAEAEIVGWNARLERRVQERTRELETSLAQVTQLHGLLPICAWCKKIRDDKDYWQSVEQYVADRTDVRFSHGICPDCQAQVLAGEGLAERAGERAEVEGHANADEGFAGGAGVRAELEGHANADEGFAGGAGVRAELEGHANAESHGQG